MAVQLGRRIIFDNTTGKIIMDMGEMQGDVLPRESLGGLDFIDLPYGQDADKFMKVKAYHIDTETKTVIFDELREPELTPEEKIVQLQKQLAEAQAAIQ